MNTFHLSSVVLTIVLVLTPAALGQCELDKLLSDDGVMLDDFGYAVAIFGDTALVGAPEVSDPSNGNECGAAYIFRRSRDPNGPATGWVWEQESKLMASDGEAEDHFGLRVAISGNVAVIGAPNDDDNGSSSGSAYVFRFDPNEPELWVEEAKLLADDPAPDDLFGNHVAISGNTIVVGAIWDDDNGLDSGSAYVFRFDPNEPELWAPEAKLLPDDGAEGDLFGSSAISDNVIVVGAYHDDDNGTDSGSAYVFRFHSNSPEGWVQEAKLLADDGSPDDLFGLSVSISGEAVVIGAPDDDDVADGSGSAYVFRYTPDPNDPYGLWSWVQAPKLTASDAAETDWFGSRVAISGDTVLIGVSRDENEFGYFAGAAYLFRYDPSYSEWVEVHKLLASDGYDLNYFGRGIAIHGDTAVIGATGGGNQLGSAYLFNADWFEDMEVDAASVDSGDYYGARADIWGNTAVISASSDDPNGTGSAYILRYGPDPYDPNLPWMWSEEARLTASDSVEGDNFGLDVSIYGGTTIIGASNQDNENGTDAGAAYVFYRVADNQDPNIPWIWIEADKLIASDGQADAHFGGAIALCDDTVIIGARHDDAQGTDSGSAYVFRRIQDPNNPNVPWIWIEEAKLTASDGAQNDWFGWNVDISGDVAVVGSSNDDDLGSDSGSVYVFRRTFNAADPNMPWIWIEEAKLTAPDGDDYHRFDAPAIDGDTIIVGARYAGSLGWPGPGVVYVYRYTADPDTPWVLEDQLMASDGANHDRFGVRVALFGDTAVIGADYDGDNGYRSGSAYVFRRTSSGWVEVAKLLPNDGAAEDKFGSAAAVWGDTAVIGAPHNDGNGVDAGAVYFFDVGTFDCNGNGMCNGRDIAEGTSEDWNGDGIPDECPEDMCFGQQRGDINGDGSINSLDIDPFVLSLTDPGQYNLDYAPLQWRCTADINCDYSINSLDIDPFIACLTGGCPDCPE